MKSNIKATNFTLTSEITDYIEKRLTGLEKFTEKYANTFFHIEVGRTTNHHKTGDVYKAEITAKIGGNDYFASAEREDLYSAIDAVRDVIGQDITTQKDKNMTLWKRGAQKIKSMMKGSGF